MGIIANIETWAIRRWGKWSLKTRIFFILLVGLFLLSPFYGLHPISYLFGVITILFLNRIWEEEIIPWQKKQKKEKKKRGSK